jgi:hypothetical protein
MSMLVTRKIVGLVPCAAARWALGACLVTSAVGIGAITTTSVTAGAVTRATHLPQFPATSTLSGYFSAVAVVPHSSDAIAVGGWSSTTTQGDLIEEWKGSSWKKMTPPNLGKSVTGSDLTGVWAASASDAWAVGSGGVSGVQLIHWNGKIWSPETVTGLPANSSLNGISGASSSDIWSVGTAYNDTYTVSTPLELHFNGKSWTLKTQGPTNSGLYSVSAASAKNVWALGYISTTKCPHCSASMVLHYNGTSWSKVSLPAKNLSLSGISASGSTAWAVGGIVGKTGSLTSLYSMRWNGTKWATVKLPSPSGKYPSLSGVVTLSSAAAWADGIVENSTKTKSGVFMEEFTKGKWSVEKVPSADVYLLDGFAASSSSNIWAVGDYFTGKVCASPTRPLSYHHTSTWKLVAAAAPTAAIAHC